MSDAAERMARSAMDTYRTRAERAALRCGLADAAALCDALSRDIAAENRGRGGKGAVTKLGLQLEAIAKRCADAIWAMREHIEVPEWEEPEPDSATVSQRFAIKPSAEKRFYRELASLHEIMRKVTTPDNGDAA